MKLPHGMFSQGSLRAGPVLGSALYSAGGFQLPFWAAGLIGLFFLICSCLVFFAGDVRHLVLVEAKEKCFEVRS